MKPQRRLKTHLARTPFGRPNRRTRRGRVSKPGRAAGMRPLTIKSAPLLNSPRLFSPRPLVFRGLLPVQFRPRRLRPWSKLGFGLLAGSSTCCCCVAGVANMGATTVAVKSDIGLTETEERIFRRLLDVVQHFKMEVELRVAGGWVRDKLLGRDCYDIDIALDKMLGREFCEKVNEFLALNGEETQGVGVIQSNPDQSKHLETARMRIYDTWIDFVNLRSETYAENSRIPTMMFGTAEEDAYRRDLTINSLFYNINKNLVEDFTGRGIEDLKCGMIITPLPPKATFLDDPLRVLRALRFGARFGFTLDEDLKKAAADEEVKAAIANKISRERIGHEIDSMFMDNHPVEAMSYLCELKLFWVVFSPPHNSEPAVMEETDRLCVEYMNAAWNLLHSLGCSMFDVDHRRLCLYGALFLPLRKLIHKDRKLKEIPVSSHIIRNSLKLKASDAETVVTLHSALGKFVSLITFLHSSEITTASETDMEDDFLDAPHSSKRRILAGLFLRQVKDFWPVALLLSTLLHPLDEHADGFLAKNFQLDSAKVIYLRIREIIITELDLDKVWEVKPLVKGDDIMETLQLKRGPQIREWQDRLIRWQLAHPQAEKEEALDWMRSFHAKRAKLS